MIFGPLWASFEVRKVFLGLGVALQKQATAFKLIY
jgi:hypothetical protein